MVLKLVQAIRNWLMENRNVLIKDFIITVISVIFGFFLNTCMTSKSQVPSRIVLIDGDDGVSVSTDMTSDKVENITIYRPEKKDPELITSINYKGFVVPDKILWKQPSSTYYYYIRLGNLSDSPSGPVDVSVVFPEEFVSATVEVQGYEVIRKQRRLAFNMDSISAGTGVTFTIAVRSKSKPDLANTTLSAVSKQGQFEHVALAYYETKFQPASQ